MQPLVTFLHDDLRWSRRKTVLTTSAVIFLAAHVPVLGLQSGALDEIDFWAGTFGVTLFASVETILFVWLFRPEHAWEEIHRGAQVRTPWLFLWLLTYVTPLYLFVLFAVWAIQYSPRVLSMACMSPSDVPGRWGARLLPLVLLGFSLLASALLVYHMLARRNLPADILEPHPSSLAITGTGPLVAGGLLRLWARAPSGKTRR